MAHSLKRDLDALASTEFDLCIVGGGITGVCVAHDAALRGLKVALVERGDFAEGTSSASTRLIHGGTRYLEHYEFGLVREALRERRIWTRLAPHLVGPVPFMIPIYEKTPVPAWMLRAGMLFYDGLSFDKNWGVLPERRMSWHHYIAPERALELEPTIPAEGLRGASLYYDGQAPNPMRLCVEIAKTAAANGAVFANYARVTGLRIEGGRVTGVEILDRKTGRSLTVRARLTVNCAGIWAVEVMKLLGVEPPVRLKPSKGIHVVTRPLSRTHALVNVFPNGRRVMIIPWRGKSLIGTTDVFYDGDIDRIRPTAAEVLGLLAEVNEFLPAARLTMDDVQHAYAGARPLIERPGKSASDLSRKYKLIDHGKASGVAGMLSVVGGKLTTSRSLAESITDRALKMLGRSAPCRTEEFPIAGGEIGSVEAYLDRMRASAPKGLDRESVDELVSCYGSGAEQLCDAIRADPRLAQRIAADRPIVLAQVHHAVEHESATSIADVALRRTDAGSLGDRDGTVGRLVGNELQRLLGWSDEEKGRQLEEYLDLIAIDGQASPQAA